MFINVFKIASPRVASGVAYLTRHNSDRVALKRRY